MPAVGAVIAGAWTAIGSWTIGSFAIGTVVQSAIVGAAIGGLSSAVMGGDIAKGMLFGALGGAVTGAIGAFSAPASGGLSTTTTAATSAVPDSVRAAATAVKGAQTGAIGAGSGQAAGKGLGSMLGGMFKEGFKGSLGEGLLTMAGSAMEAEDASKEAQKQREWQAKQNEANRELQMKLASMRGGGGGGSDGVAIARIQQETALKQLAENRRQYDVARQDQVEARKRSGAALAQVKAGTKAYKAGVQSLDEASAQVEANRVGMLAGATPTGGAQMQETPVQPEERMVA